MFLYVANERLRGRGARSTRERGVSGVRVCVSELLIRHGLSLGCENRTDVVKAGLLFLWCRLDAPRDKNRMHPSWQ